ncbi:MAG: hypothetical protein F4169_04585 [Gammaproteobacteria bacterium]|nr:hypothetical protein [Rhodothermaceae bacterium]MYF28131.1 hypothetical protein [Gammaproteobacteria bacterium]
MAEAALGKAAVLKVGPSSGALTTITADGSGLASYEITDEKENREIPGSGDAVRRQSLDRADGSLSITIDLNSISRPLFFGKSGDKLYFEEGIIGDSGGDPKRSGNGFMSVAMPVDTADAVQMTITVELDGGVTHGNW